MKGTNPPSRAAKLATLARIEAMTTRKLVSEAMAGDTIPGICMNKGCDYTCDVEGDQDQGWCERCNTNTVMSALVLADIL